MSSAAESEKLKSGPPSSTGLSEFDAEYACSDHMMVRKVVQTAVRNYFSASCSNPARMTLCIDFTEGAPVPSNSTPLVRYQAPLVQINVERKPGIGSVTATTAKSTAPSTVAATEKAAHQGKTESRKQGPLLQAVKKLAMFTIKEEVEDLKLLKATKKILKPQAPVQNVCHIKCIEKNIAREKVFPYQTVICKALLTQQQTDEWRRKFEEDRRELYASQQLTLTDSSDSVTVRSEAKIRNEERGTITEDERTIGWGTLIGAIEFEPKNDKGYSNKTLQIRGNLSSTF